TARTSYEDLPAVRPPSDGTLPTAPAMGATKKQKQQHAKDLEKAKAANATQDQNHESDKRAAEAAAANALAALDRSLTKAADKMRPVAGMDRPAPTQPVAAGNRPPGMTAPGARRGGSPG